MAQAGLVHSWDSWILGSRCREVKCRKSKKEDSIRQYLKANQFDLRRSATEEIGIRVWRWPSVFLTWDELSTQDCLQLLMHSLWL